MVAPWFALVGSAVTFPLDAALTVIVYAPVAHVVAATSSAISVIVSRCILSFIIAIIFYLIISFLPFLI